MNQDRIDHIIKLCLAAAADRDWNERELGPIHLVKYVYLADLLYAEKHGGETYTGAPWIFYHFGPWSPEVFERVVPAVQDLGAIERSMPSQYGDKDWVRWRVDDSSLADSLARDLPLELGVVLPSLVKRFGGDTYTLLNDVYLTNPMLKAAPNERLDFTPPETEDDSNIALEEPPQALPKLSVKKRREWEAKRDALRQRVKARAQEMDRLKTQQTATANPSIYDDVFFEGVQWLDSLTGEPVEQSRGRLIVDDSVWKSSARGERDEP